MRRCCSPRRLARFSSSPTLRFIRKPPGSRYEPANGPATLCGVAVETDDRTGLAVKVAPVRIGGRLSPTVPDFWE